MSEESDDFDALESLLLSANKQANKMRERAVIRRTARTQREVSEDYASRLSDRATFRRLLSEENLDGVRFRWLWDYLFRHNNTAMPSVVPFLRTIDDLRKWIDDNISREESPLGPSS